jgi:hypothetical protein
MTEVVIAEPVRGVTEDLHHPGLGLMLLIGSVYQLMPSTREQLYARSLRRASDVRRFTISNAGSAGWQVREEQNSCVVHEICYDDWHRVERAKKSFSLRAESLTSAGWTEA